MKHECCEEASWFLRYDFDDNYRIFRRKPTFSKGGDEAGMRIYPLLGKRAFRVRGHLTPTNCVLYYQRRARHPESRKRRSGTRCASPSLCKVSYARRFLTGTA